MGIEYIELVCCRCKKTFKRRKSIVMHQISYYEQDIFYCSQECIKIAPVEVKCNGCDCVFLKNHSEYLKAKRRGQDKFYCNRKCRDSHATKIAKERDEKRFLARFWDRVNKTTGLGPDGDCWEWEGARDKANYGRVQINRKVKFAHRVSYEIANGPFDQSLLVCHRCDNPSCVRPDHLFLGTAKSNNDDKIAKQRHCFGQQNHWAKLSEKEVIEIRCKLDAGWTLERVAEEYGVHKSMIVSIGNHVSWKVLKKVPKRFYLMRDDDPSCVSGLGIIASGVMFEDGKCVFQWMGDIKSVELCPDMDDMNYLHGHEGKTHILWIDHGHHEKSTFRMDPTKKDLENENQDEIDFAIMKQACFAR